MLFSLFIRVVHGRFPLFQLLLDHFVRVKEVDQGLQFGSQVDVLDPDPVWGGQADRGKVHDPLDPGFDHFISRLLGRRLGNGQDSDPELLVSDLQLHFIH